MFDVGTRKVADRYFYFIFLWGVLKIIKFGYLFMRGWSLSFGVVIHF